MMIRYILLMMLGLTSMLHAQGEQNGSEVESGSVRGKTFKVSCFGKWKHGPAFAQGDKGEESIVKVEILDMGYSAEIPYKPGNPIKFLKETGQADNPYKSLFEVVIPGGIKSPLVLLLPVGEKVKYRVFDIHPSKFPYGACQMVNFSSSKLQIAMNDDVRSIAPGVSQIFDPIAGSEERAWMRVGDLKTKKLVFSSMMMRRAQKRMLVFLINDKGQDGSKQVKTRMLIDFKPAKKKAIQ